MLLHLLTEIYILNIYISINSFKKSINKIKTIRNKFFKEIFNNIIIKKGFFRYCQI